LFTFIAPVTQCRTPHSSGNLRLATLAQRNCWNGSCSIVTMSNGQRIVRLTAVGMVLALVWAASEPPWLTSNNTRCPAAPALATTPLPAAESVGVVRTDLPINVFDALPRGFLTTIEPRVYVVANDPDRAFLQYQHDAPAFSLLKILRARLTSPEAKERGVLEIGAGYATLALYASRLGFESIAVEPEPEFLPYVQKSMELNGTPLRLDTHFVISTDISVRRQNGHKGRSFPLDEYLKERSFELVKIDAIGYETLVLQSGLAGLKEQKMRNIVMLMGLVNPDVRSKAKVNQEQVLNTLHQAGYAIAILPGYCFVQLESTLKKKSSPFAHLEIRKSQFRRIASVMEKTPCLVWAKL
jgi:hypothetical protein